MGLLDLFKSKEQKESDAKQRTDEEKRLQIQTAEEQRIDYVLKQILVFPGSKKEFEEFVGYECAVIDTERRDLGITYYGNNPNYTLGDDLSKKLVDNGIVGIVNATPISIYRYGDDGGRYGLPVARKK
ncbi:MAG: hypothetical protein AABX39_00450 [Nanoarchaeota archaeon]